MMANGIGLLFQLEVQEKMSLIGKDVEITGTIKSAGSVRIDGKLDGELICVGDVQVGEDYRLLVYPKQSFEGGWLKDYIQSPVAVPAAGLELEIKLEVIGDQAVPS